MNPMKRVGLAALVAVGVALFTSTLARAGETYELTNVCDSGDQDADATGQVTYGEWRLWKFPVLWRCRASISCQNLTPGATYESPVGTLTANAKGSGKVSGYVSRTYPDPFSLWAFVYRLNADNSVTLVLSE
jgi:hypothetical protein